MSQRSPRRATLLLLALVALACGPAEEPAPSDDARAPSVAPGRVLLVGLDGVSTRMCKELMDGGGLPHLRRLRDEGLQARLDSRPPYFSPRIWNTIATGKQPEEHGITNFVRSDAQGRYLMLSTDRKVHALWNIASDAGLRVATINWWNTYPPDEINGVVISDHAVTGDIAVAKDLLKAEEIPTGPKVYPAEWGSRLAALLQETPIPAGFKNPITEEGGSALPDYMDKDHLTQVFVDDARVIHVARAVEASERPDLLMVFLPGIDRYSHWLWGGIEPLDRYAPELRPTAEQNELAGRILRRYYEYTDALIGPLLDRYGPNDLVVILSDHGFERAASEKKHPGNHLTAEAGDAVLFARGPGVAPGSEEVSILDVTPTILTWLGLASGEDMPGRATAFIDRPEISRIATHDRGEIARLPLVSSGKEEEILDQLEALGYIE